MTKEHKEIGQEVKIVDHIRYDDTPHTYTNINTGELYISATSLIGKYEKQFETEKMSYLCAKRDVREGLTELSVTERQEELKRLWKEKNERVCKFGTQRHLILEDMLTNKLSNEELHVKYELEENDLIYIQYVRDLKLDKADDLILEDLLYSDHYKLAGQSDVVRIIDGYVHIDDWKFNSKPLEWEAYNNQKRLGPLHPIPQSKLHGYEIQANIYMYLKCKMTGLKPGSLRVHHFLDGVCTTHKFELKQDLVEKLFDYYHYKDRIEHYSHTMLIKGRQAFTKDSELCTVLEVNPKEDEYTIQVGGRIIEKLDAKAVKKIMMISDLDNIEW